jgi:hypothetical protein
LFLTKKKFYTEEFREIKSDKLGNKTVIILN